MSNKVEVWYSPRYDDGNDRLRFVYPDGRVEWLGTDGSDRGLACYYYEGMSKKRALKAMRQYDRACDFKKAIKIGEL